jgi:hypothetical protein
MARRQRDLDIDTPDRGNRRGRYVDEADVYDMDGFGGDGMTWGVDEDLEEASMEDLRELADELEIEDYETLSREELKREIRRETRAEP